MLVSRQSTVSSVRRDAWLEVDLSAIEANVGLIKSWIKSERETPALKLMGVVKSDAYGHGAPEVAEVLIGAGCEILAVASVDEGCQLRAVDPKVPILILSPTPSWALSTAVSERLEITVTALAQVKDIERNAVRLKKKARVHLKVDTGMHRLGIDPDQAGELVGAIISSKNLELASIFSHLASAGDERFTRAQDDCFGKVLAAAESISPGLLKSSGGKVLAHIASSEAARLFPFTHHDMVRAGLHLYGLESRTVSESLAPAMSVRGRINHIKEVERGEPVGYSLTWTPERASRLASIPIGYADGVDRGLSNRMSGILMGKTVPQVGTISMDQMIFDITDVPEGQEGDVITLIGEDGDKRIHLADWAGALDTITYELACRLKVRLPRIYTRHHQIKYK